MTRKIIYIFSFVFFIATTSSVFAQSAKLVGEHGKWQVNVFDDTVTRKFVFCLLFLKKVN